MNPNIAGLIAIAIFSLGFLMVALANEVPIYQLMAMTSFLAFLSISAIQKLRGKKLIDDWREPPKHYALIALGHSVYLILCFAAMKMIPIFEVNVLNYVWPFLLVVLTAVLNKKRLSVFDITGALMGFFGTVMIFQPDMSNPAFFENFGLGHVFIIVAACSWAFYSAKAQQYTYSIGLVAPVMFLNAVVFFVLHLLYEEAIMPSAVAWIGILSFGLTRFCLVLWDYGVRHGDEIMLASVSYFIPMVSAALLIVFGFTPANAAVAFGGVFIIIGCLVVNGNKLKQEYIKLRKG